LKLLALVIIDEDVSHDRVKPSFDIRTLFEILLVPQCLDHSILNQVFCVLGVPCEAHGETFEKGSVHYEKGVEFESAHIFLLNDSLQRLNKNSFEPRVCLTFIKNV
jgi:hypothetical protein